MSASSVFYIPPEQPFVDVLARWTLERFGADPMQLARTVILLPNRRAQRALHQAFLRAGNGAPMLLPRFRPIGDVDEDELLLTSLLPPEMLQELRPPMPPLMRQLYLTRLVWTFQTRSFDPKENIEQAARLAQELASFLDETLREQCDMGNLETLVPDDYQEHWKIILAFLELLTHHWPRLLEELGMEEAAAHRSRLLTLLAQEWRQRPPAHPVIVAGTTGSMPAVTELIRVVAALPQGHVILPGLDTHMNTEAWQSLEESHPQWGLRHLLNALELPREEVKPCGNPAQPSGRAALMSHALLPAEQTERWVEYRPSLKEALRGLRRIDCATPQEEALAIALLMRETLETPGATAALVTHDRALGRRVSSAMRRFGVTIDDSAGTALSERPEGAFFRLVAEACAQRLAPVPLLSLLKHPLCAGGMSLAAFRRAARELELAALRGVRPAMGWNGLMASLADHECSEDLKQLCHVLEQALQPLMERLERKACPLAELLDAHLEAMERLAATDEQSGEERLWLPDAGEQLAEYLQELKESGDILDEIDPVSYPGLLATLLSEQRYRPRYATHPRLHILGPLEARLQHYDRIILGGMNEGSWPPQTETDPWMSRPMRAQFGLPSPERRVGLAAHDFATLACANDVILTRAEKVDGAPTIPSRWLMRLDAVIDATADAETAQAYRDTTFRDWARAFDRPDEVRPVAPPEPRPPLLARPRELSVTRVERLMRDPYGIYAEKILGLKKLRDLDEEPDVRHIGTVIHHAFELFAKEYPATLPEVPLDALLACGKKAFSVYEDRPAVSSFWWPRFARAAESVILEEKSRRPGIERVLAESKHAMTLKLPAGDFTIAATMDRVELRKDGTIVLADYKTGGIPTRKQVEQGIACQLTLEALMLQADPERATRAIVALEYWKIFDAKKMITCFTDENKKEPLQAILDRTRDAVFALLSAFDDPDRPYRAEPIPDYSPEYNDYRHLARIDEWSGS